MVRGASRCGTGRRSSTGDSSWCSPASASSIAGFYFDTALASGPALPTLMAFAGSSHILFGTDSPYYEHGVSAACTAALDADNSLTADDQAAISHGNAQTLFPRLAQRDSHHRAPRRMTLANDHGGIGAAPGEPQEDIFNGSRDQR